MDRISCFQNAKEVAEIQGVSEEKKLKEASDDLIHHLGDDSPAAKEVQKQVEEVDSVRQDFIKDIGERIEKVTRRLLYDRLFDCLTFFCKISLIWFTGRRNLNSTNFIHT